MGRMNHKTLSRAPRRPLHLSVVTETYPPDINGVALTVAHWIEGLRQRGHQVELISVRRQAHEIAVPANLPASMLLPGFQLPAYPQLHAGWPAKRTLLRHWQKIPPDLVHIVTEGPLGYSALQAARQLRIAVSTSFHTHFQHYSRHYHLGWLARPITAYLRHFHNQGLQTLVPTQELASQLQALGFQHTQVLARGVDTALFSPQRRNPALRASWGVAAHALAVLCVGRLAAEKNLPLAIAAFQAIRRLQPDARLILVGDGPLAAQLRAQHPDFVYCGMRQGNDLAAHYASSDLFLFPSLTETFGNVVLEAMASGLAVVTFDYAAGRAHVTPDCGLLAPFGDATAFIAAATALTHDTDARLAMGQAARHRALDLDSERIYDRLEDLFKSILSQGETPCPTVFRPI